MSFRKWNLRIKWYYDHQKEGRPLSYYAISAGLVYRVSPGRNLIHWTPTGSTGMCPSGIGCLDQAALAGRVTEFRPAGDLLASGEREFHFHKEYLAPREDYRLPSGLPRAGGDVSQKD